eukprot:m.886676 g.886676  ORF g.886676 m.886676 type:complete len:412 (-) comp23628_c0_seq4:1741-2976(-)
MPGFKSLSLWMAVTVAVKSTDVVALDNGAALTPPMGWSTWNKLRCNFNADRLLQEADHMVSSGMLAAGYTTLNIDDCWMKKDSGRTATGEIIPDPNKFPYGMKNFSDELAVRGIGLGIYTAHGKLTCQKYPASLGYEEIDAKTYASWNVVYVKNDWCWRNEPNMTKHLNAFNAMRDALNKTGRPIVHSIHWNYADVAGPGCPRNIDCPLPNTANMWRIGGDIRPNFETGVLRLIDIDAPHASQARPGAWGDADMLEVGNGMTVEQDQAHFSMWCILASPLVAGNDLSAMSVDTKRILTNKWAIAVNQDPLGIQASLVANNSNNTAQVWSKRLSSATATEGGLHPEYAVVLLNRGTDPIEIIANFSSFGASGSFDVLDLWNDGKSIGIHSSSLAASVGPTSAVMYRLIPSSA